MSRLLIHYSCGAGSAVACKITLNDQELISQFDEVLIINCYVKEEPEDNRRFLSDCEKWLGQKIIVLQHEAYKGSIYNVFEKNYMRTPKGAPCTRALKKQVRTKFQREDDTHVFGFTFDKKEIQRAIDFELRNNVVLENVLIDREITKENCLAMVERAGIELPEMYKLGYEHSNCIGCVKGGMGYWNKIRIDYPEAFDRMAKFERLKGYTCLKEPASKKPESGKPLFLDTLDPKRGNFADEPKIECGIACEIEERQYSETNSI